MYRNITHPTLDELDDLYNNKQLSQEDIAQIFGVHCDTIIRRMNKWKIQSRPPGQNTTHVKEKHRETVTLHKLEIFDGMQFSQKKPFVITPDYIVGLTDGEGSFSVSINYQRGYQIPYCYFSLSNIYREIVYELKNYFGFGGICPGHSTNKPIYTYYVKNLPDQLKLSKFFLDHPLCIKQEAFDGWFRVLRLIAEHKHITEDGLSEIQIIKANLNH